MGTYRFLLSILVLFSHIGIGFYGYNQGVSAVISFYILSGFVMTALIERYYLHGKFLFFYTDRFLRIFPQFIFYSLLATLGMLAFNFKSPFLSEMNFNFWLLNIFMLPQGYFMFIKDMDRALLIPQTWSLGLELTFYLLIPFIIHNFNRRKFLLVSIASLFVYFLSFFGFINTDYYGYRLIPGTMFVFMIGVALRKNNSYLKKYLLTIVGIFFVLYLVLLLSKELYLLPYNKEVVLGVIFGTVFIFFISTYEAIIFNYFGQGFKRFDKLLGDLSYGVFLNHFIINWMMVDFFGVTVINYVNLSILCVTSIFFSYLSYEFIEKPCINFRKRFRAKVD